MFSVLSICGKQSIVVNKYGKQLTDMKTTHPNKTPRVKRTMTLSEEIDCKVRTLAASKRIAVGVLVEAILKEYLNFTVTQSNE